MRLALPLVAMQLGQIAIYTTDVVMIGWLGPEPLAASVLGFNVNRVLHYFCLGVLTATSALAVQAIGAGDERRVQRVIQQGLWVAIMLALPASYMLWHTETILRLLGQTPRHAAEAAVYARATLWGFGPGLGFVVLRCFVSALSRPRPAMVIILFCVGLNALCNYGLIFGHFGLPRLELMGAGMSSSVVQVVMFISLLIFVLWHRESRRFQLLDRVWCPDWHHFGAIVRLGLPIGGMMLCERSLFALAAILMGWVGTAALAAHAIAMQCAGVSFMVPLGIGLAGTVRVGLAAGRHDLDGIRRAGWTSVLLGLGFMGCASVVFLIIPRPLVGLFLDLHDAETIHAVQLAIALLAIAALFQLADGAQVVMTSVLRGLSDTRIPLVIALVGYYSGLGVAYLLAFPLNLGGRGIWYGLAFGLSSVASLLIWRFWQRERLGLLTPFTSPERRVT